MSGYDEHRIINGDNYESGITAGEVLGHNFADDCTFKKVTGDNNGDGCHIEVLCGSDLGDDNYIGKYDRPNGVVPPLQPKPEAKPQAPPKPITRTRAVAKREKPPHTADTPPKSLVLPGMSLMEKLAARHAPTPKIPGPSGKTRIEEMNAYQTRVRPPQSPEKRWVKYRDHQAHNPKKPAAAPAQPQVIDLTGVVSAVCNMARGDLEAFEHRIHEGPTSAFFLGPQYFAPPTRAGPGDSGPYILQVDPRIKEEEEKHAIATKLIKKLSRIPGEVACLICYDPAAYQLRCVRTTEATGAAQEGPGVNVLCDVAFCDACEPPKGVCPICMSKDIYKIRYEKIRQPAT